MIMNAIRSSHGFAIGLALVLGWAASSSAQEARTGSITPERLPSFSEEREAAALHFVRKHAADLLPILEKLKTADAKKYQTEVRELFQVSELLTELRDQDEKRHGLELEVWKIETLALITVAKMANVSEEEQAKLRDQLLEHTKRLVELDMQVMKQRVDDLEKELGEARDDLAKGEERREQVTKERYERLMEQAKRRGMMK
jgi:hypothetical protein